MNSIVYSLFYYLAFIYLPDKDLVSTIRKYTFSFLWYPLIAQRVKQYYFFLPKNKGGCALTHLNIKAQSMCVTSTLKAALATSSHPGTQLARYNFARPNRRFFPKKVSNNSGPNAPKTLDQYARLERILCRARDQLANNNISTATVYGSLLKDSQIPTICTIKHNPLAS